MPIKIITTEDGSHSLYDEELNETYHSTKGARGESDHVFIKECLKYYIDCEEPTHVRILEIGFGTGLNAFLTVRFANDYKIKIQFTTLEPFPIKEELYTKLNFAETEEEQTTFQKLHSVKWNEEVQISNFFRLNKKGERLEDFSGADFDMIYFDAFAPSKQAEVWSTSNLRRCYVALHKCGILTTYCAQGQFKRNLAEVGFEVETLQGAMGKKEMVRATK